MRFEWELTWKHEVLARDLTLPTGRNAELQRLGATFRKLARKFLEQFILIRAQEYKIWMRAYMSSSGSAYGQCNCHGNSGNTNFGHTKWRPSSSIYTIYEGSTYNLFTKGEGEDGHEGKGKYLSTKACRAEQDKCWVGVISGQVGSPTCQKVWFKLWFGASVLWLVLEKRGYTNSNTLPEWGIERSLNPPNR